MRKEVVELDNLSTDLVEELNAETAFTIPILGGIKVAESVVITWLIIAVLLILSLVLVRNLKVRDADRKQLLLEVIVNWMYEFFDDTMGEHGRSYIPYLSTVGIYLGVANLIGLVGLKPPTKDLGVTAALSLMSIILVEYAGFHRRGAKGWVKSLAEPVPIIAPLNVLEIFIRPLSLCMRLFGNILGSFVVMELIKMVAPIVVPVPFSFYFDIFDGLLQAYVFVFLTSLFVREAVE